MASDWRNITLGDFVTIQRGHDLTSTERRKGSTPVVGAAGQNGFHDTAIAKGPGIVIGRSGGSFGQVHYSEVDFWPHNTGLYVTDFKGNDPRFAFYLLKQLNFTSYNSGSAQPSLNRNFIYPIPICVPKPREQRAISNVLSALDTKIEINNRINEELEGMAKLLYDYWFVQFDFPITAAQAAAMGKPKLEGKPYRSSSGKMVYNNVLRREIPAMWEEQTISRMIALDKSGDWGKEASVGNYQTEVYCIRGTDLGSLNGIGQTMPPTRFILPKNEFKILKPNDIIIEISGGSPDQSTGRASALFTPVLERFDKPLICSNFCKALSLKTETSVFYFYRTWVRLYDNGVFFNWEGKTSGIKNLLFDSFANNHHVVKPDKEVLRKFDAILAPFEAVKQKNLLQNKHLTELRDWLLPMLMNGQVTVR